MKHVRSLKSLPSLLAVAGVLALAGQGVWAADKLPSFKVDDTQTSVSGLSSGAFMAVQLQVAHSASIVGAGVVAGGPYYCAADNMMYTAICMGQVPFVPPNAALMVSAAKTFASQHKIDSLSNLAKRQIYVFSGTQDTVVKQPAVDATVSFFTQAGVSGAKLKYVNNLPAGHAVIEPQVGNECGANASPYMSHCGDYDQAGELLSFIHGPLKPKAQATTGRMVTFDQRSFAPASTAMAPEAYLYVPKACDEGQTCKVHVAIHGCVQSAESVGDAFITNSGYNAWADTNNFLVLYPQVNKSMVPTNPQGCWDWWGYTGPDYAVKSGAQISAIMKMVKALGAPAAKSPM